MQNITHLIVNITKEMEEIERFAIAVKWNYNSFFISFVFAST